MSAFTEFASSDRLPPLQEVSLPTKPEAKEGEFDRSTCDTFTFSNGMTMPSMRSVPSADSMKCRVKNTFLHFEESAVGLYIDCSSARRSRSLSPQPAAVRPVRDEDGDDDDDTVSVPDTDDGVSPTATERYRKFFNEFGDEFGDDELASQEYPTPPLSPMPPMMPQMVTGAYAFPHAHVSQPVMMAQPQYWVFHQPEGSVTPPEPPTAPMRSQSMPEVSSQDAASRACAGKRRENAWKNMSCGLGEKEVAKPQ